MSQRDVAIVGAGPYGLSLAAHLAAKNIKHRIFGQPMAFWSAIAAAGDERYLKSFCFGTNIASPTPGHRFADYSEPRGLETFEPCSIADFVGYGRWFQENKVSWVEPTEVIQITRQSNGFAVVLADGERFNANQVVVATGLAHFAYIPPVLASLPETLCTHTADIRNFSSYQGKSVAVVGAGQSALEAAALLREAGAWPKLLVRENSIKWQSRISRTQNFWQRIRSPISGLGTGPKAWALSRFPGAIHRMPAAWRTRFVKRHLPAEGAWWLRERVENRIPVELATTVIEAHDAGGSVALKLRKTRDANDTLETFDHLIAGSGYVVDVARLSFLDSQLRHQIETIEQAPKLNANFESSVDRLFFVGPAAAMSFGPLYRFVVGAGYSASVVSARVAATIR